MESELWPWSSEVQKQLAPTLPISTVGIVAALGTEEPWESHLAAHLLQAFRLIFTAARVYVGQACHFTHPRQTFLYPQR